MRNRKCTLTQCNKYLLIMPWMRFVLGNPRNLSSHIFRMLFADLLWTKFHSALFHYFGWFCSFLLKNRQLFNAIWKPFGAWRLRVKRVINHILYETKKCLNACERECTFIIRINARLVVWRDERASRDAFSRTIRKHCHEIRILQFRGSHNAMHRNRSYPLSLPLSLVLTHRKILFRPDDISTTSEMRRSWNALSNWKTARPSTSGKKCTWLSRSFKRNLLQYEIQSRLLVKKSSVLKLRCTILLCCVVKYAANIWSTVLCIHDCSSNVVILFEFFWLKYFSWKVWRRYIFVDFLALEPEEP